MKKLIAFCLLLFLIAFSKFISAQTTDDTFAIYTLKDTMLLPRVSLTQQIDSLELADTPFLTALDLVAYGKSTHSFVLIPEMNLKWRQLQNRRYVMSGVPFVITVGKERIYIGTFWWSYSSMRPPNCAFIEVLGPVPYKIELGIDAVDKRNDPRIINSLRKAGILVE